MPETYQEFMARTEPLVKKQKPQPPLPSLTEERFEPPTAVPTSTDIKKNFDQFLEGDLTKHFSKWDRFVASMAKGPDGTIFSGPVGGYIERKMQGKELPGQAELDIIVGHIAETVGSGAVSGLTFGAIGPHKEQKGTIPYQVGRGAGMVASLIPVTKAVSAIPVIGKVPGIVGGLIKSGVTGAVAGGVEQGVRAIKGEEVKPKDIGYEALSFIAFDGLMAGAGVYFRYLKKLKDIGSVEVEINKAMQKGMLAPMEPKKVREIAKTVISGKAELTPSGRKTLGRPEPPTELEKHLVVNNRAADTPAGMAPYQQLQKPAITADELHKLMTIPIQPERSALRTPGQYLAGKYRTPIRMYERYGLLDDYHGLRVGMNRSGVRFMQWQKEFHKLIRKNIPFSKRAAASDRIGINVIARQKGGEKLLIMMGKTEVPKLSAGETKVLQAMDDYLKTAYDELNIVRPSVGVAPFKPVKDYFPFMRKLWGESEQGLPFLNMPSGMSLRPQNLRPEATTFRYAKHRVLDDYGSIDVNSFNIMEQYMRQSFRHIEMTPAIAKMRQKLDGDFFNGFKLKEHNPTVYKDLNDDINFLAGIRQPQFSRGVEKILRKLNENIGWSTLTFLARSTAIQPTASWNTMRAIGINWYLRGVTRIFNPKYRKLAMQVSDHLPTRAQDVALREMREGVGGTIRKGQAAVAEVGLYGLQRFDFETAMAGWWGAFEKAQSKGFNMGVKEAGRYADDIVIRTQGSGSPVDIAPIQKNALGKTMTLFNTFVINNIGFVASDIAKIGTKEALNRKARDELIKYMAGMSIINTIYEDGLGMNSPFPSPIRRFREAIEKKEPETWALIEAAKEAAMIVPAPVGGSFRYTRHPGGALVDLAGDAMELTTRKGARLVPAVSVLGKLVGVPGTQQAAKILYEKQRREKERKKRLR